MALFLFYLAIAALDVFLAYSSAGVSVAVYSVLACAWALAAGLQLGLIWLGRA